MSELIQLWFVPLKKLGRSKIKLIVKVLKVIDAHKTKYKLVRWKAFG